jgi:Cys-tRNA(Pro)/Cys-tRNA(Cys) deacylase
MAKGSTGTPATVVLTKASIPFTIHQYDHDPRSGSYGLEAAAALGLDPALVFKTLIATVDGTPAVAIVPVTGSLDLKQLATALAGRRADLADAALAQRLTGYVLGGISPIGQRKALITILDDSAEALPTIYVSGGRRGLDIGIAPQDLLAITGGRCAAIARAERS